MTERTMVGRLEFPLPATVLSVNETDGTGWKSKEGKMHRDAKRAWKMVARATAARWRPRDYEPVPLMIQVEIPFAVKRIRDPHNYTGTVAKWIVDALVSANVVPDDNPKWVTMLDPVLHVVDAPPFTVAVNMWVRED